ncbi:MAG: DUF3467 domain-containing protein [Methanomicrobiales archaeon]
MSAHEIQVQIPQTLDPVYSNRIQIAYREDEWTFVFLHEIPGANQARAKAIVSISPKHAKNLVEVLSRSMAEYEKKFGEVTPPEGPQEGGNVTIRGYH